MKRIVEYQLPPSEFDALVKHLGDEGKYKAHWYMGMPHGTIDDKSSTDYDHCKRFSSFEFTKDKFTKDKSVTLRIEDYDLAKTIDLYFLGEH